MLARQIVVGFGIAAVFPTLIYFGLSIVYPPPNREDHYRTFQAPASTATAEEHKAIAAEQAEKRQAFNTAARAFARVMFAISTVLGVIAILLGAHLRSHAVGAGLILGGIGSLALGCWAYATHLDDSLKFLSLLAGIIALLFVGLRKLTPA